MPARDWLYPKDVTRWSKTTSIVDKTIYKETFILKCVALSNDFFGIPFWGYILDFGFILYAFGYFIYHFIWALNIDKNCFVLNRSCPDKIRTLFLALFFISLVTSTNFSLGLIKIIILLFMWAFTQKKHGCLDKIRTLFFISLITSTNLFILLLVLIYITNTLMIAAKKIHF